MTDAKPTYSRALLRAFVVSASVTAAALLGLLASPFYTSPDIVTWLFASAGIGIGALAIVVRKAERVRQAGEAV